MDDQTLTHLGIGGLFAIMVLREVFSFLRGYDKVSVGKNGKSCVTKQEFDDHKKFVQYKDNCTEIVKRIEGEFRSIEDRDSRRVKIVDENFKNMRDEFKEVKTLIRNGAK